MSNISKVIVLSGPKRVPRTVASIPIVIAPITITINCLSDGVDTIQCSPHAKSERKKRKHKSPPSAPIISARHSITGPAIGIPSVVCHFLSTSRYNHYNSIKFLCSLHSLRVTHDSTQMVRLHDTRR